MKCYAVIDTNVIVSALLNKESVPGKLLVKILQGHLIPVVHEEIIAEYFEVLMRPKFNFNHIEVKTVIDAIYQHSISMEAQELEEELVDPKDIIFYAVTMEARNYEDVFLVTGNTRHFPVKPYVVTPKEMLDILIHKELI